MFDKSLTQGYTSTEENTEQSVHDFTSSLRKTRDEKLTRELNDFNNQAKMLQEFAAQSKRNLNRSKALEQVAKLWGYKDYQTALAAISSKSQKEYEHALQQEQHEHIECFGIDAWEEEKAYASGQITTKRASESFSVTIQRDSQPSSAIEVVFELDVDMPRVLVYSPDRCDDPMLSVHSGPAGLVLQYMPDDDQFFHKNRADPSGYEMISNVAHAANSVWFIPMDSSDSN